MATDRYPKVPRRTPPAMSATQRVSAPLPSKPTAAARAASRSPRRSPKQASGSIREARGVGGRLECPAPTDVAKAEAGGQLAEPRRPSGRKAARQAGRKSARVCPVQRRPAPLCRGRAERSPVRFRDSIPWAPGSCAEQDGAVRLRSGKAEDSCGSGEDACEDEDELPLLAAALGAASPKVRWLAESSAVCFMSLPPSPEQEPQPSAWQLPAPSAPELLWRLWEGMPCSAQPDACQEACSGDLQASGPLTELVWSSQLFSRQLRPWLRAVQVPKELNTALAVSPSS